VKWVKLARLKSGHTIFRGIAEVNDRVDVAGDVAIADRSGPVPDQTDDGILWLDPSRPMLISPTGVRLPVIVEHDGHKAWTHTTPADVPVIIDAMPNQWCAEYTLDVAALFKAFDALGRRNVKEVLSP
jgi:hypothetical protein